MKLSDEIWEVIRETAETYHGEEYTDAHRDLIEMYTSIKPFDGGVFLSMGNEFDLFVVPEKRGKWRIREEITKYLEEMHQKHGTVRVGIDERNSASLRLAKHFGFVEVERNGTKIKLERKNG